MGRGGMLSTKATYQRVVMIGLDGCEPSVARTMMDEGKLPAMQRLLSEGACFLLEHGDAKRTGLAWEHVASGLDPDAAERWAAVDFNAATYAATQRATNLTPFSAFVDVPTVVVDPPYFDLGKTNAHGLVAWGAHDPGVPASSHPPELLEEVSTRFGAYAAKPWIYGFVWPSAEKSERMADEIVRAVEQRSALSQWMLAERFPDWRLGLVVISEYHSAIEAMWHGVDPTHPLHKLPSAPAAKRGIEGVYEASDRLIADLMARFPDAAFVVFNLHGMGPNNSDNASMALLPELMYRKAFGKPLMRQGKWRTTETGVPLLGEDQRWQRELARLYEEDDGAIGAVREAWRRATTPKKAKKAGEPSLSWMPATRYAPYWRDMPAFALPSFYDGRIRINLKGREANGLVEASDYRRFCAEIADYLRQSTDPITGKPAVDGVDIFAGDPLTLGESGADIIVTWTMAPPLGLSHPQAGLIGPLPYRRTGGHTGDHGFAYFHGPGIAAGHHGVGSAFDVVPSVLQLLGAAPPNRLSGRPLEAVSG